MALINYYLFLVYLRQICLQNIQNGLVVIIVHYINGHLKMKLPYRLFVSNGSLSQLCHRSYYRFLSDSTSVQHYGTSKFSTFTVAHNLVSRGLVSPQRSVPYEIVKPDYVSGNRLSRAVRERVLTKRRRPNIEIKSDLQIQGMRDACRFGGLSVIGHKTSSNRFHSLMNCSKLTCFNCLLE